MTVVENIRHQEFSNAAINIDITVCSAKRTRCAATETVSSVALSFCCNISL